jgi:hypothetical protein
LENAEDYESMMEDIEEYRKSCLKKKNGIVKKFSIALSDTSNTPEGSKVRNAEFDRSFTHEHAKLDKKERCTACSTARGQ